MPSHPDRVRQNYCKHDDIVIIESDLGKFLKCMKCGKEQYISPKKKE